MKRMRALATLTAACGVIVALAGCSQIAAIAPVGGDRLAEVRYVANDTLVDAGTELLTAPVCTQAEDDEVTCEGETLDGEKIRVLSRADDQANVTITVGDATLYSGSIKSALEKASQG